MASRPAPQTGRTATTQLALWAPVALYMGLIFYASSRPIPDDVGRLLPDKVVHAGEYAVLCLLLVRALAGGWGRGSSLGVASAAVALTVAYGATDEVHQAFVPTRTMDLNDLVADAIGAAAAASALYAWGIIRPRDAL